MPRHTAVSGTCIADNGLTGRIYDSNLSRINAKRNLIKLKFVMGSPAAARTKVKW